MSIKDNVDYVKQELNSEEKFLESTVKVERFYKKYKPLILGLSAVFIVAAVAFGVKSNLDEKNKIAANNAFDKLLKNPKDAQALETLKESNKKLYEVALYLNAKKENKDTSTNVKFLKELAAYDKALNNKNIKELNSLSMDNNFLLKEFAIFNKALLLTQEGKYKEASTALKLIPNTSSVFELAKLLNHHLATKI